MKILFICLVMCISFSFAQEKTTIAVLDLEAVGISNTEAQIMTDRLRIELFKTIRFIVLERDRMNEILNEQGFQLSGCTSNECAVEAGRIIGVQQMVAGSIGKIGDMITVAVRLIDVSTAQIFKTATEDCPCRIEIVLTRSIPNVAKQIAGLSFENTGGNYQLSPDAYNVDDPDFVSTPEIRYAISLHSRENYDEATKIIFNFLKSENIKSKEEASAFLLIWGLSNNLEEDFEKFKAFYPRSRFNTLIHNSIKQINERRNEQLKKQEEERLKQEKERLKKIADSVIVPIYVDIQYTSSHPLEYKDGGEMIKGIGISRRFSKLICKSCIDNDQKISLARHDAISASLGKNKMLPTTKVHFNKEYQIAIGIVYALNKDYSWIARKFTRIKTNNLTIKTPPYEESTKALVINFHINKDAKIENIRITAIK